MVTKRVKAARLAVQHAKEARLKVEKLAKMQKEDDAAKLAAAAAVDMKRAEEAAAEVIAREEALQKGNPTLWAQFKKWL